MPELAIDRAIAAVLADIVSYRHGSSGYDDEYDAHAKRQTVGLRAALTILEVARAWADIYEASEESNTGATQLALRRIALFRAIRGEPC